MERGEVLVRCSSRKQLKLCRYLRVLSMPPQIFLSDQTVIPVLLGNDATAVILSARD
jgi:hypothetical protein